MPASFPAAAQGAGNIRGIVINSVTREPISRALVVSNDNRFAALTDEQGRFAFSASRGEADHAAEPNTDTLPSAPGRRPAKGPSASVPYMLFARKPGFLPDSSGSAIAWDSNSRAKDLVITLVPEARITGKVSLSNNDSPGIIHVQLYRRLVQGGHARWVFDKTTPSRADGEFRFAELSAGTYKLFTTESMDRYSQIFSPRGTQYGYPPSYYGGAGFDVAAEVRVSAGDTATADFSVDRQPYYNVRIPVANAPPTTGFSVNVYPVGHRGPGYTLGYSIREQAIRGALPNGIYTVEATSYGGRDANAIAIGSVSVTLRGGPAVGPAMALTTASSIPVMVKEEFTSTEKSEAATNTADGKPSQERGPRRYLNVVLEASDEMSSGRGASLRDPARADDESLLIDNVTPGLYWVRVMTSRGYVASLRAGNADLSQQPLVVSAAGSNPPIEITMRDETGEIEGTIEGIASGESSERTNTDGTETAIVSSTDTNLAAHVYCIPLPDGGGSFSEAQVSPDGTFRSPPLAPGTYRVLAFERSQPELEYGNADAMRSLESKGQVVRLSPGQKERLRLQLIRQE